eukprot:scaffold139068_cov19-Tisochrysis_lutea.AAC.1
MHVHAHLLLHEQSNKAYKRSLATISCAGDASMKTFCKNLAKQCGVAAHLALPGRLPWLLVSCSGTRAGLL